MFLKHHLFPRAGPPNYVALLTGLSHDHPAELLSLDVLIAKYFLKWNWNAATVACEAAQSRASRQREEKRERCWRSRGRRVESVFSEAFTNSGVKLEEKLSQAGFCGYLAVFFGPLQSLHRRQEKLSNVLHLFEAKYRVLSHEDVAAGTRGGRGTF